MGSHAQGTPGIRIHMHADGSYAADGTLFKPDTPPPFAAILLLPDEEGVGARATEAAQRFAAAGYFTVALDLNRGLAPELAQHSAANARQDIDAALAFLASQPDVRQGGIGVVGWGSGAVEARRLAGDSRVRAVALEDARSAAKPAASRSPILVSSGSDRQVKELRFFAQQLASRASSP